MKNLFLSESQTNLDLPFEKATESLNNFQPKLFIETEFLREFLESISAWILKNFSSPKLNSMLNFLILLFNKIGYTVEISREGI